MGEQDEEDSVLILQAISSSMRLRVLELLEDGGLRYNDLMRKLGLDQKTDAGKFSFHIKKLMRAELIELNQAEKKYQLTKLGDSILRHVHEIKGEIIEEEKFPKVRTSKLKMEPFDRRRIAESLTREAKMEEDEAEDIALEVQDKILRLKVKYLTAPLIRELVIATVMERGMEKYRHKLTRLGMPVFDVGNIANQYNADSPLIRAGREVFLQYVLLEMLPKSLADIHLSGQMEFNFLSEWALRPEQIVHIPEVDLEWCNALPNPPIRLKMEDGIPIPSSLDYVVMAVSKETCAGQTLLQAPETQKLEDLPNKIRFSLAFGTKLNISIRGDEKNIDGLEKMFVALSERGRIAPLDNLRISIIADKLSRDALRRVIEVASSTSAFGAAVSIARKKADLMSYDHMLVNELTADTMDYHGLTILGSVRVDLPTILMDSKKKESIFFDKLKGLITRAKDAFHIRLDYLTTRVNNGTLPVFSSVHEGRRYIRDKQMIAVVQLDGIYAAAMALTGDSEPYSKSMLGIIEKMANSVRAAVQRESDESIVITANLTYNGLHPPKGQILPPDVSNLESWLRREAELQTMLTGSGLVVFDVDGSEMGAIRPEEAFDKGIDIVTLYSQRQMCSICGAIVPKNAPVCPYCGSRVFVSRDETLENF